MGFDEVPYIKAMLDANKSVEYPFAKGPLTANGIQWSAEATSSTTTYKTVEAVTIQPSMAAAIKELELGITWAQRCDGATARAVGKIQGRNKAGTWVDLMAEVTNANAGTAYEEKTYSGRFKPTGNLDAIPFELQVLVKSDGATAGVNAVGKVKNSSYVAYLPVVV